MESWESKAKPPNANPNKKEGPIFGFAMKMLGKSSKNIIPNGGLMVMNPMVQSKKNTHTLNKSKLLIGYCKVGPLPLINGVITPISRVKTPVTHL